MRWVRVREREREELTVRATKVDVVFDGEVCHHFEELQEVLAGFLLVRTQTGSPVLAGIGTGVRVYEIQTHLVQLHSMILT